MGDVFAAAYHYHDIFSKSILRHFRRARARYGTSLPRRRRVLLFLARHATAQEARLFCFMNSFTQRFREEKESNYDEDEPGPQRGAAMRARARRSERHDGLPL